MWSVSSAVLVTLVFSSHVATDWIAGPPPNAPSADWSYGRIIDWNSGAINVPLADWSATWRLGAMALAGAIVFAAGWILGWLIQGSWRDFGRSSWQDLGPAW
jgi:hypothetical protein